MVSGRFILQTSGGNDSAVAISAGGIKMSLEMDPSARGDRAQEGRVAGLPFSLPTVSFGKLTMTFFFFCGSVTAFGLTPPGNGLSFLAGPPRTAFGGPPILSWRLFLFGNGCEGA